MGTEDHILYWDPTHVATFQPMAAYTGSYLDSQVSSSAARSKHKHDRQEEANLVAQAASSKGAALAEQMRSLRIEFLREEKKLKEQLEEALQDRATMQVQIEQLQLGGELSASNTSAELKAARLEIASLRDRLTIQEQTSEVQARQLAALSFLADAREEELDRLQVTQGRSLRRSATVGVQTQHAATTDQAPSRMERCLLLELRAARVECRREATARSAAQRRAELLSEERERLLSLVVKDRILLHMYRSALTESPTATPTSVRSVPSSGRVCSGGRHDPIVRAARALRRASSAARREMAKAFDDDGASGEPPSVLQSPNTVVNTDTAASPPPRRSPLAALVAVDESVTGGAVPSPAAPVAFESSSRGGSHDEIEQTSKLRHHAVPHGEGTLPGASPGVSDALDEIARLCAVLQAQQAGLTSALGGRQPPSSTSPGPSESARSTHSHNGEDIALEVQATLDAARSMAASLLAAPTPRHESQSGGSEDATVKEPTPLRHPPCALEVSEQSLESPLPAPPPTMCAPLAVTPCNSFAERPQSSPPCRGAPGYAIDHSALAEGDAETRMDAEADADDEPRAEDAQASDASADAAVYIDTDGQRVHFATYADPVSYASQPPATPHPVAGVLDPPHDESAPQRARFSRGTSEPSSFESPPPPTPHPVKGTLNVASNAGTALRVAFDCDPPGAGDFVNGDTPRSAAARFDASLSSRLIGLATPRTSEGAPMAVSCATRSSRAGSLSAAGSAASRRRRERADIEVDGLSKVVSFDVTGELPTASRDGKESAESDYNALRSLDRSPGCTPVVGGTPASRVRVASRPGHDNFAPLRSSTASPGSTPHAHGQGRHSGVRVEPLAVAGHSDFNPMRSELASPGCTPLPSGHGQGGVDHLVVEGGVSGPAWPHGGGEDGGGGIPVGRASPGDVTIIAPNCTDRFAPMVAPNGSAGHTPLPLNAARAGAPPDRPFVGAPAAGVEHSGEGDTVVTTVAPWESVKASAGTREGVVTSSIHSLAAADVHGGSLLATSSASIRDAAVRALRSAAVQQRLMRSSAGGSDAHDDEDTQSAPPSSCELSASLAFAHRRASTGGEDTEFAVAAADVESAVLAANAAEMYAEASAQLETESELQENAAAAPPSLGPSLLIPEGGCVVHSTALEQGVQQSTTPSAPLAPPIASTDTMAFGGSSAPIAITQRQGSQATPPHQRYGSAASMPSVSPLDRMSDITFAGRAVATTPPVDAVDSASREIRSLPLMQKPPPANTNALYHSAGSAASISPVRAIGSDASSFGTSPAVGHAMSRRNQLDAGGGGGFRRVSGPRSFASPENMYSSGLARRFYHSPISERSNDPRSGPLHF